MIYLVIAIFSGATIVIARIFNAQLASHIGLLEGSFYNFMTGLLGSLLLAFSTGEILRAGHTLTSGAVPLWAYLGGVLGLGVVLLSNALTPKLSNLYMTLFIFLGQLVSGFFIDWMLQGSISNGKLLGGFLVLMGLCYNLYLDYTAQSSINTPS